MFVDSHTIILEQEHLKFIIIYKTKATNTPIKKKKKLDRSMDDAQLKSSKNNKKKSAGASGKTHRIRGGIGR